MKILIILLVIVAILMILLARRGAVAEADRSVEPAVGH